MGVPIPVFREIRFPHVSPVDRQDFSHLKGDCNMDVLSADKEAPFVDERPQPLLTSNSAKLMNTAAVNMKVARELLEQAQTSLDSVEIQLGHRAHSVPGQPSHIAVCEAVGPPSAHYSLFQHIPVECDWAKKLERQLRTQRWALLEEDELAVALSLFPLSGTQRGSEADEPTQYRSALDLTPSEDNTQELRVCGADVMESNSSEANMNREDSEDEGPPRNCTLRSPQRLYMEVAELSSITHSPPHPQKKSIFYKRPLAPCYSTPQNPGVQRISEDHGLVCSPHSSQSFYTAVDEQTDFSFQQPCTAPDVRGERKEQEAQGSAEREAIIDMKETQEHLEEEDCLAEVCQELTQLWMMCCRA